MAPIAATRTTARKKHYVLDVENENLTSQAVNALVAIMPVPKKNGR